jgi:hypothetical protein
LVTAVHCSDSFLRACLAKAPGEFPEPARQPSRKGRSLEAKVCPECCRMLRPERAERTALRGTWAVSLRSARHPVETKRAGRDPRGQA